jgi:uncharacterized protein (DUF433 family)
VILGSDWLDLVFPNEVGRSRYPDYVSTRFATYARRAGLPHIGGPHGLRHSLASALDARLVDPYRNFGRSMFGSTATPVGPVLDRIEAGEPVGSVAQDYGLDVDEIELVVRHAPAIAA